MLLYLPRIYRSSALITQTLNAPLYCCCLPFHACLPPLLLPPATTMAFHTAASTYRWFLPPGWFHCWFWTALPGIPGMRFTFTTATRSFFPTVSGMPFHMGFYALPHSYHYWFLTMGLVLCSQHCYYNMLPAGPHTCLCCSCSILPPAYAPPYRFVSGCAPVTAPLPYHHLCGRHRAATPTCFCHHHHCCHYGFHHALPPLTHMCVRLFTFLPVLVFGVCFRPAC